MRGAANRLDLRRWLGRASGLLVSGLLIVAASLGPGVGWAQNFGAAAREPYIRLEWQLGAGRRGAPLVTGFVYNNYGESLGNVRLFIEEVDATGNTVSRTIGYVDGPVPPKGRLYFETSVPRAGATYRVTILYFDLFIDPGNS